MAWTPPLKFNVMHLIERIKHWWHGLTQGPHLFKKWEI
jgi:hypothetical protein